MEFNNLYFNWGYSLINKNTSSNHGQSITPTLTGISNILCAWCNCYGGSGQIIPGVYTVNLTPITPSNFQFMFFNTSSNSKTIYGGFWAVLGY